MNYYLVKFALGSKAAQAITNDEEYIKGADEEKIYLLDEKKYNDWCMADGGTEGYKIFEVIWKGPIEQFLFKNATDSSIFINDILVSKS